MFSVWCTLKRVKIVFLLWQTYSKIVHFIACNKTDDVKHVADLFFKEVVRLRGICRIIFSDKEVNFLSLLESIVG